MNFSNKSTHIADLNFVRTIMSLPLLSHKEEQDLANAWLERQDEVSLQRLVSSYSRLVVTIAIRYRRYGLPLNDLIQEGILGLLQAAQKFQPDRNIRFSAYAKWWVRAFIQDFVLRNWSIVRTGSTTAHKKLFFSLNRLRNSLNDLSGDLLSTENRTEIAQLLQVTLNDVETMEQRLASHDFSLNAPVGEDGNKDWQELLQDQEPTPEEQSLKSHAADVYRGLIHGVLDILTPRERFIIEQRRLVESPLTLEALGEHLSITKERVRQIEGRALRKMRYYFARNNLHEVMQHLQ